MKEATGELSTTVIAVVAIAAISAIFVVFLLPQLKASIILNQACSNGPGYWFLADANKYAVSCSGTAGSSGTVSSWTCYYMEGTGVPTAYPTGGVMSGTGVRSKVCQN